ncbi:hypothetical protein JG687_00013658, partial [Phytophthora cactorum]
QTYLHACRYILFYRLQNLFKTGLPPYNSIARRWVRGCPVDDIAVGDVGEGEFSLQSIKKKRTSEGLKGDDKKYSKGKNQMEKLVWVLSAQITPTFKAALRFLDGFAKSLQEGSFIEFAAGLSSAELSAVKTEDASGSCTSLSSLDSKPKNWWPCWMRRSNRKWTSVVVQVEHEKEGVEKALEACSPPRKRVYILAATQETRARQYKAAAKTAGRAVRSAMEDLDLELYDVQSYVEICLLKPGQPVPDVTRLLDISKIEEVKAAFPFGEEEPGMYMAYWRGFGCITKDQLTVIINVKQILRDVGFTLDWIDGTK